MNGREWWCLPGGGVEPGETPAIAAIRELQEECGVIGTIIRETSRIHDPSFIYSVTYLMEIGSQEPVLGIDPEFMGYDQILVEMRWMTLAEIPERDRAFLWAAGLMCIPAFHDELICWEDDLSYPT